MNKLFKTKWFTFGTYLLLVLVTMLIGYLLLHSNETLKNDVLLPFFDVTENRTFDYRQSLIVKHHPVEPSKDIIVLAIDDASLEVLWDKYGEWPIPRNVYADALNHIEKSNPKAVVFDLMFIKSMRSSQKADEIFVQTMNKYNNVYTGLNFDDQPEEVRKAIDLPQRLEVKTENHSKIDFAKHNTYTNCRAILSELINGNVNIGLTNILRNSDGIIRKVAPIMTYKGKYYPHLTFLAGSDYLTNTNQKDFVVDKNSNLLVGNTKLPLTKEGEVILNWYGKSGTHNTYPMYKVINEMEKGQKGYNFENKIVIIGTTAMSLHDTKSVPIQEGVYPGVEVHATFLNNMLDNNFIKQTSSVTNIILIIGVIGIIGLIVMLSTSTLFAMLSTILFGIAYLFVSYYVMLLFNLWIPIVIPVISMVLAFALSFLAKYLIKSRDFEYQYRLATIDGLTELYNHRYFQDTLRKQVEVSKRYGQKFSLIMVDIDFFKKFNDTYGHQAGDAVLIQVAQTLKKNSRSTDYVCRYGGEEMTIILPNTGEEEVLYNANRIRQAVAEREFQISATAKVNVTISVGIATFPQDADSAQALIEKADQGLYYAKEHGRNQVGKVEK